MPKCCEGCHNLREGGSCTVYKHCLKWRIWYAVEWERIRIAASETRKETTVNNTTTNHEKGK